MSKNRVYVSDITVKGEYEPIITEKRLRLQPIIGKHYEHTIYKDYDEPWYSEGQTVGVLTRITIKGKHVTHFKVYIDEKDPNGKENAEVEIKEIDLDFVPQYYLCRTRVHNIKKILGKDNFVEVYPIIFLKDGAKEKLIRYALRYNKQRKKFLKAIYKYRMQAKEMFSLSLPYTIDINFRYVYEKEQYREKITMVLQTMKKIRDDFARDPYYFLGDLKYSKEAVDTLKSVIIETTEKGIIVKGDYFQIYPWMYEEAIKAKGYIPIWLPRENGYPDWNYGGRRWGYIISSDIESLAIKYLNSHRSGHLFAVTPDYKSHIKNDWIPKYCIKNHEFSFRWSKYYRMESSTPSSETDVK